MANLSGFNANEVPENEGFDPIPAGEYVVAIVDSEQKQTSSGNGSYLKLAFQVLEGQHKGRKLFENLNLDNPNAQAVQIARGTLSSICRATGVMEPKDSVELHNIPILAKVGMRKREDTGEMQNRITKYSKKGQAATPQTTGTQKPWERKA